MTEKVLISFHYIKEQFSDIKDGIFEEIGTLKVLYESGKKELLGFT